MDSSVSKKKLSALLIFIACLFLGLPAQAETFTVPQDASPESCVLPQDASPDECFGIPQDASPEDIERYRFSWKDLTPIKDQGTCGSSWAFSTVGAMEDKLKLGGYPGNIELSKELLIGQCGCSGDCQGGLVETALYFLVKNGTTSAQNLSYSSGYCLNNGSCTQSCSGCPTSIFDPHPCTATCSDLCPDLSGMDVFKIIDYNEFPFNPVQIKTELLNNGPLVAYLSLPAAASLNNPFPVHAVELVGFDDCSQVCHDIYGTWGCWKIKNSWGVFDGFKYDIYHKYGYGYIPYCTNTPVCKTRKKCASIIKVFEIGNVIH